MLYLLIISFVGTPLIVLGSLKILKEVVNFCGPSVVAFFEFLEEKVQQGGDIELQ